MDFIRNAPSVEIEETLARIEIGCPVRFERFDCRRSPSGVLAAPCRALRLSGSPCAPEPTLSPNIIWNVYFAFIDALFLGLTLAAFLTSCSRPQPPYEPQAALETFEIEAGFRIELFAHEPDITDRVAMDVDQFGRIYILENRGYPLDTESRQSKAVRSRRADQRSGDGGFAPVY